MAKVAKNVKKDDTKMTCPICGKAKNIGRGFYNSNDPRFEIYYGKCYWCKECLEGLCFDENGMPSRDKFREVLRDYLNMPFYQKIYEEAMKKDNRTLGYYIRQLNLQNKFQPTDLVWTDGEVDDEVAPDRVKAAINKDEKVYNLEWMGTYSYADSDYLNDYLSKLQSDFNIITTNHMDYARKIAKASLATDKAYEAMIQGVSGADKRYKDLQSIFDTLSKSAQFSENTRGANDAGISGISQVVDKIESKQWIYDTEEFPEDELDHLLKQFANIRKSL